MRNTRAVASEDATSCSPLRRSRARVSPRQLREEGTDPVALLDRYRAAGSRGRRRARAAVDPGELVRPLTPPSRPSRGCGWRRSAPARRWSGCCPPAAGLGAPGRGAFRLPSRVRWHRRDPPGARRLAAGERGLGERFAAETAASARARRRLRRAGGRVPVAPLAWPLWPRPRRGLGSQPPPRTRRLLPTVDELTIVTLAPEPVAFTSLGVSYLYGDLRQLPFRDDWFDEVACLSTLEHVGMDNAVYGAAGPNAADARPRRRRLCASFSASFGPVAASTSAFPSAAAKTTDGSASSTARTSMTCSAPPASMLTKRRSSSTPVAAGAALRPGAPPAPLTAPRPGALPTAPSRREPSSARRSPPELCLCPRHASGQPRERREAARRPGEMGAHGGRSVDQVGAFGGVTAVAAPHFSSSACFSHSATSEERLEDSK